MRAQTPVIYQGDARALPLPDESVDLVVTSPPYFGLRSYTDGGEHYAAQVGAEATPTEFLDALIACTAEMMRVLKPSGSLFVNLGDKYSGVADGRNNNGYGGGIIAATHSTPQISDREAAKGSRFKVSFGSVPYKSLCLLPERYRIRCVDDLGLIARAVLIWSKPNGLPESVTDRVRRSHEDWVHLTKMPRYYSAVDEIREVAQSRGPALSWQGRKDRGDPTRYGEQRVATDGAGLGVSPLGKLPGSVWEIATQPLKVPADLGVDHFAAFPMEWPRRIVQGWSPRDVCTACGQGRRPVSVRESEPTRPGGQRFIGARTTSSGQQHGANHAADIATTRTITGYACDCPDTNAPSTPGVVLDPFSGTGTTALVATMLGRRGIGVDLSADYCRLAQWRAADPKERARAAGLDPDAVAAIKPQLEGQVDMFDLLGGEAS